MGSSFFYPLLWLHALAGSAALSGGLAAMVTAKGGTWHRRLGRVFSGSMLAVSATAFPIVVIHPSAEMLTMALLNLYLVTAGWRAASDRQGRPRGLDWANAGLMATGGLTLVLWSALL